MGTIRIKNLRLRTIIGFKDWERDKRQDVVINAEITVDSVKSESSDDINDSYDYKRITKTIIEEVEGARFNLLESLTAKLVALIIDHPLVKSVRVKVDKPHALRFVDSVSYEIYKEKQ